VYNTLNTKEPVDPEERETFCRPLVELNFNSAASVYLILLNITMIRHTRVITAAVTILCLGLTLVLIDSLSTVKLVSRRPSWKRKTESRQCPPSISRTDRESASRLFSASDFSSHPYSVYYGTSGSTAQQNFGQNDDINDVYGYGPDARVQEEPFDDHHENRHLQSMQDIPLLDGRRGATVFSRKYNDGGQHFYEDPNEREGFFHEDRYIEDEHMMEQVDSLLHERDHLRRKLDAVVCENMHLQNQQNLNGGPQVMPPGQNQYSQKPCPMPPPGPMQMGADQSTRSVVDSVMEELKNMQRTVQAVERNTNAAGNFMNSPAVNSEAPTVERIKSELRNMEQVLQNLDQEQAPSSAFETNKNSYDASTAQTSQPEYTSVNGSASAFEQQRSLENNIEARGPEYTSSGHGSTKFDHAQLFNGANEVVMKAELKKKNGVEGTRDPVERQIDVSKEPNWESPTVNGETAFSSEYI
jgi:hypothetical protein